ncbi:4-hydroxythreonine-4-phosphate dehydrogenase PdxA [bacterium]|nr:4-hydroxythreonine-4-phosphate dehydrogenase PdxA [bacterium]
MKPVIGITLGDVAGIGPEVVFKALGEASVFRECRPVVIGDGEAIAECGMRNAECGIIKEISEAQFEPGIVNVLDLGNKLGEFKIGRVNKITGAAAISYIKKAVELALKGEIKAVVTAPISKEAINLAGYKYPGHTELLAELTGTEDFAMMLACPTLRVVLVTTHLPLAKVPGLLSRERIMTTIRLTNKALIQLGIPAPKIAVAGLNPHAGEGGLFGREEEEIIAPSVKAAREEGIDVEGPYPPDTVFRLKSDAVVVMYHDQGLIPIKLLAFEEAVNVTLGMPIVRTSPDHGTGFDIAGKNLANPASMIEAIRLAVKMVRRKAK